MNDHVPKRKRKQQPLVVVLLLLASYLGVQGGYLYLEVIPFPQESTTPDALMAQSGMPRLTLPMLDNDEHGGRVVA